MPILHSVHLTDEQKEFLQLIIHTDAASSLGGAKDEVGNAVQWCVEACMRIENKYGIDACYVSFNDIRYPENDAQSKSCRKLMLQNKQGYVVWADLQNFSVVTLSALPGFAYSDNNFLELNAFVTSNPLPGAWIEVGGICAFCVLVDK